MSEIKKHSLLSHPERKDDEVFIGNFTISTNSDYGVSISGYDKIESDSKRLGNIAYDSKGAQIQQLKCSSKLYPVFINKKEHNERIKLKAEKLGFDNKMYKMVLELIVD